MCGIVGYVGNKDAKKILLEGLLKLEYRGYDSAGFAVENNNCINCLKCKGRVRNLIDDKSLSEFIGNLGIAHTRWATHGEPSTKNSHPHLDNEGKIAVVHNGIIENYVELKNFLLDKGYVFLSDTDTEVIPNLIDYYYKLNNNENFLYAVKRATDDLIGSYALEILSTYNSDEIIITRKDSPLVIGKGVGENYICSDVPAVLSYTNVFYYLGEKEFAVITKNNIDFYSNDLESIAKEAKIIDWENSAADKGNFEDYMLKEIFEQPKKVEETFDIENLKGLDLPKDYLKDLNKIVIVACGTAKNAGTVAKNIFEALCRIETLVEVASEFRYRNPIIDNKTLAIFISQSGETADTIAALKLAKSKGAKTVAVTNVKGSSITREADYSVYTLAGPEIAVASTKAYTSQIALLTLMAIDFAEKLNRVDNKIIEELKAELPNIGSKINYVLENKDLYHNIVKDIINNRDVFFIGRGIDYSVAEEGALKLKEISYIHAESYSSGELKHGPIALIEKDVPVIGIITDEDLVEKSVSNMQEVISRGAKSIVVTNQEIESDNFDYVINIPKINKLLSPILSVIPLQLISYYAAKEKSLDVDKPRNLAKSVTVE